MATRGSRLKRRAFFGRHDRDLGQIFRVGSMLTVASARK